MYSALSAKLSAEWIKYPHHVKILHEIVNSYNKNPFACACRVAISAQILKDNEQIEKFATELGFAEMILADGRILIFPSNKVSIDIIIDLVLLYIDNR